MTTVRVQFTADVYAVPTEDGQRSFHAGVVAEIPEEQAEALTEKNLVKIMEDDDE